MNTDEQVRLLDDLQGLLEKQIETARRGNLRRVEALAGKADSIVARIVETKALESTDFDGRREHLTGLYKTLELILATGKEAVGKQLRQVGSGRRTLQAYRNSG